MQKYDEKLAIVSKYARPLVEMGKRDPDIRAPNFTISHIIDKKSAGAVINLLAEQFFHIALIGFPVNTYVFAWRRLYYNVNGMYSKKC